MIIEIAADRRNEKIPQRNIQHKKRKNAQRQEKEVSLIGRFHVYHSQF